MTREYFHADEEKLRNRILVLKEIISEHNLSDTPCPLLVDHLSELSVLCGLLRFDIQKLVASLKKQ
jgi:hypothetical protein